MKKILIMLIAIMLVVGTVSATATTAYAAEVSAAESADVPGVTLQVVDTAETDNLIQQTIDTAMRLVALVFMVLATRYVIPWLKEKGIYSTIQKFVQAAEKLGETGAITKADKKGYVWHLLEKVGIKKSEKVDAMIESAVKELDWMGGELVSGILCDGEE